MSFQDIDNCDQAVLISSSHADQLGDIVITPNSQTDLQYPQFNQSNILSDVSPIHLPAPQYLSKLRKSIVP